MTVTRHFQKLDSGERMPFLTSPSAFETCTLCRESRRSLEAVFVGKNTVTEGFSAPCDITQVQCALSRKRVRAKVRFLTFLFTFLNSVCVCCSGGRDRAGRAVVELYGDHLGWNSSVTSRELFMMLLYFHSITR